MTSEQLMVSCMTHSKMQQEQSDDVKHRCCLQEATAMNMPSQMHQLFATLMILQPPSDIRALIEDFKEAIGEDYIRYDQLHEQETTLQERHIHLCLWDIEHASKFMVSPFQILNFLIFHNFQTISCDQKSE